MSETREVFNTLKSDQEYLKDMFSYNPSTGAFIRKSNPDAEAGSPHPKGYIHITVNGKKYLAHRLAWVYMTGSWPSDQIDHINCIKSDNRIDNLREATNSENHQNKPLQSNNKSGFKGVHYAVNKDRWVAYIKIPKGHEDIGKRVTNRIHLGSFKTKDAAIKVRREAELKYHKDFARAS
jgi:hypothetical protein